MISRIAPTPSSYLHIGNAINFLLTWVLIKKANGQLLLRIDDLDQARTKNEFIEDIFAALSWLNLDYDSGPKNTRDFLANHSQSKRKKRYWQMAEKLLDEKKAYVCKCSRREIKKSSPHQIYPGTCRKKKLTYQKNKTAIRFLRTEKSQQDQLGDFVIWRKEDQPAYQLVSVVDDIDMGVNLIVRGEDLYDSTLAQKDLANALGFENFQNITFFHHPLLQDENGNKLSKSLNSTALKALRKKNTSPVLVYQKMADFFGFPANNIINLKDLLALDFCLKMPMR